MSVFKTKRLGGSWPLSPDGSGEIDLCPGAEINTYRLLIRDRKNGGHVWVDFNGVIAVKLGRALRAIASQGPDKRGDK